MVFHEDLLKKREELIAKGINPYPYDFKITHSMNELRQKHEELNEKDVAIAGRVTALRRQGQKVFFADIEDFDGRIQVYLKEKDLPPEAWQVVLLLDIGDWLGIQGKLFTTKTGELTVWAQNASILSKAVIRVPISKTKGEKSFYQLSDSEILYRQRYLSWITNKKTRNVMVMRARIISEIRKFMESREFLEVVTPTIEMVYGGAAARPFETSIHSLSGQKAYLRISPELPLKKFIVGGFPKVYTICQNFRNEGIDRSHNPEFTMMEWYEAFTDYDYQMRQFEELVSKVIQATTGNTKINYQGTELDFTPPWVRLTMIEAIEKIGKVEVEKLSEQQLIAKAKEVDPTWEIPVKFSRGHVIDLLFEGLCEKQIIQPTFILDHPLEISPLTKKKRGNPQLVERFEPFVAGIEIGNAYSELTDPVEQYDRLKQQRQYDDDSIKKDGVVHHPIDIDFITAIGLGMPPTGGVGLGIDRLVMLIADEPCIRDVIAFPLMKPSEES